MMGQMAGERARVQAMATRPGGGLCTPEWPGHR
jgi:hypothetical protein